MRSGRARGAGTRKRALVSFAALSRHLTSAAGHGTRLLQNRVAVPSPSGEVALVAVRGHSWGVAANRETLAVAAGTFLLVAAVAGGSGGYFPSAWGWCVLAFVWVIALALLLRERLIVSRLGLTALGFLSLLVGWTALSISWSEDAPQAVLEVQRSLVYLTALAACLLAFTRRSLPHVLGGLVAGIWAVCAWALITRLFPDEGAGIDEIDVNRLSDPLGYWNGLGLFAVMGALLALGGAARHRSGIARAMAAAALPVVLTTQYFTFGRGAWAALALGLVAAIAIDPRRLQLVTTAVALAPLSAAAVLAAESSEALTGFRASHEAISEDGQELAVALLVLSVASGAVGWALARACARVRVPPRVRQAWGAALGAIAAAAVVVVVVVAGGPKEMVTDAWDSFERDQPPAAESGVGLHGDARHGERLFWLGSNGRLNYWEVSWRAQEEHPVRGTGAGSFEQRWLEERDIRRRVRDGHGLYTEVLGELGWMGLALLLGVLVPALVAAVRARGHPLVPVLLAAYVAYLAHAGVDWHWEMPAVTIIALAAAAGVLVAARRSGDGRSWATPVRIGVFVVGCAVAAFSVVGLVGNRALAEAEEAADEARWEKAESEAQKAIDWAPWSGHAWQHLGRAQFGLGEEARSSLLEATNKDPGDWRIWYDLGVVSEGAARRTAFQRAADLNPLAYDIEQLRGKGYRLSPAPETVEPR